ncbi:MAG: general secretion pathway protein GspB, partial [Dokdonella sp.]
SEQQRRLGEAPTLGSPVQALRRRRSLLPLLGALAVIALGVGWWLSRSPAVAPAPRASTSPAAPVDAGKPASATPPAAGRGVAAGAGRKPTPHFTTPATTPAAAAAAAAANAATAKPGDAAQQNPQRNDRTAAANPVPASAPARPLAAPTATTPDAAKPGVAGTSTPAIANAPAATTAPAPIANPAAPSPTSAAPASAAANTATAAVTPRATAPAAAEPALPSVWELPYATRKDIPELAMTMHVFAGDPTQRFVVIKGERHVEGDDLGDGLTLKEIRADGMVLDYKGQRFVYPRDGR